MVADSNLGFPLGESDGNLEFYSLSSPLLFQVALGV